MNALHRLNSEEKIKYLNDDQKGPSRIVIFEKDEKASKFTNEINFQRQYIRWEKNPVTSYANCYNLKRVEQYGICETEGMKIYSTNFKHSVKINYGFCGSSCKTPNLQEFYVRKDDRWKDWHRQFWEREATYYENHHTGE